MVSFRYHVITIVAVFIALAVGILMGSTLLDQGLVHNLQTRTATLSKEIDQLTKQVADQQSQLGALQSFAKDAMPSLVGGRLVGKDVVLVTEKGIDLGDLNKVRQTLEGPNSAGANVQGVVVLNPSMTLSDPASRAAAAKILGVPASTSADRLSQELARALGDRLASGPPSPAGPTDLLQQLMDAKLVTLSDSGGPTTIGGPGSSVVALSGSAPSTPIDARTFYIPMFDQLVESGIPAAAAASSSTSSPFLDQVRADGGVDGKIVTVDDVDIAPGQVALVWGLERLINGDGGGDYGLSCGSCTLAPSPVTTP